MKRFARILTLIAATAAAALSLSCCDRNAEDLLRLRNFAAADTTTVRAAPKYVFLFIGDGMGFAHIAAAEAYLGATGGAAGLSFTDFSATGAVNTHSANSKITCSAAAATALAAGVKTNNGMIGMDPQKNKLRSIAYDLKDAGYTVGIATSVSIDHATPAAFFASEASRDNYYAIASQIAPSGLDFFAGSGLLKPMGVNANGKQENAYDQISRAGYAIIRTREDLAQAQPSGKTVMVQSANQKPESLVMAINRKGVSDGWTLADFTRTGIRRLDNPRGFFFVVEGGQIDWAAHANEGAAMIHEVIDLSESVKIALEFYSNRPGETLIIITADHETGGLSVTKHDNAPPTLTWATKGHTGVPVPIFATGAGSETFRGEMDNTDIHKKIRALMIRD
jgi:alkaline phosphatase